ncbi:MAG: hypothetical protein WC319_06530 [Candidatus Paceibacterota bacterium]|jgi:hypothetical protein
MLGFRVEREMVPCLYEISFKEEDNPVLLLRLHKDFVEAKKDLIPTASFIEGIRREHNLGEFFPLREEYFGFDNAIKKSGIVGEFVEFKIKIPIFAKETERLCKYCEGTGVDNYFKRECSFCEGGRYEIFYDWKSFDAISASLQILTMMTEVFDQSTQSQDCQLFTFQVICGKGQGHYPIGGHYGISFCDWLSSFPEHHQFDEIVKVMQDIYTHIYQRRFSGWDFQACVSGDAWLIISVPGNACGIFPEGGYESGQGREFSCHNMDTPIQQIILLVALAVLSDMTREHYKARSK